MKLALLAAALLLSPLALSSAAHAQTDALPPETKAPASTMPPATAMPVPAKPSITPSKSLTVTYHSRQTVFTVEDLLKLTQVTVHVHNAHTKADETYTGPLVSDVLAHAGLIASSENHTLILHSSVVATGTDKYFVLYSAAELEPEFATAQAIIAIVKGNDLPNTSGGAIELINTADTKPARWVEALTQLTVVTMTQN